MEITFSASASSLYSPPLITWDQGNRVHIYEFALREQITRADLTAEMLWFNTIDNVFDQLQMGGAMRERVKCSITRRIYQADIRLRGTVNINNMTFAQGVAQLDYANAHTDILIADGATRATAAYIIAAGNALIDARIS